MNSIIIFYLKYLRITATYKQKEATETPYFWNSFPVKTMQHDLSNQFLSSSENRECMTTPSNGKCFLNLEDGKSNSIETFTRDRWAKMTTYVFLRKNSQRFFFMVFRRSSPCHWTRWGKVVDWAEIFTGGTYRYISEIVLTVLTHKNCRNPDWDIRFENYLWIIVKGVPNKNFSSIGWNKREGVRGTIHYYVRKTGSMKNAK